MEEIRKPNGYWSYETCKEEVLKYQTKKDLKKGNNCVFTLCYKNKWTDLFNHMVELQKNHKYYTFELCRDTTLKYKTIRDFKKENNNMYAAIARRKWYDLFLHMDSIGNKHNRLIYAVEFTDNSVYIGLTSDSKRRKNEHFKTDQTSQAYKYSQKTGLIPIFKELTEYIDVKLIPKLEAYYVEEYKNNGWKILNVAKTGSLGSSDIQWTFEECKKEALKHKTKKDFREHSNSVYVISSRNKWLDKICSHMVNIRVPKGYWDYEKCKDLAANCNTKMEFYNKSVSAYNLAIKEGWLTDICSHFKNINKPYGFWTKENCHEEALKYKTRSEFEKGSGTSYSLACKNGWLNEICDHMISLSKPDHYWTKELFLKEVLKYKTKKEFKLNDSSAYQAGIKHKWMDEIPQYMCIEPDYLNFTYVFEFEDNHVYICTTYNINNRERDLLTDKESLFYRHKEKTKSKYSIKQINNEPISKDNIKILEKKIKSEYYEKGWNILNKIF